MVKYIVQRFSMLAVALLIATALEAQNGFQLRDNDTVVFYGDSITDQRLYTTYVETFVVTRYPKMPVRFVHSGWGGDRVSGGGGGPIDERLRRDVIAFQPTVMTIMLGMNDGSYRAFDDAIFRAYSTGYEHVLQVMRSLVPGIRITLIQPSPFDDVTRQPDFPGGYNAVLLRYGEFVKELARRSGMLAADLNGPVVAALRRAYAKDPALAREIIPDRVHPEASGHLLMAEWLLQAWGASPLVTAVEIDAASGQVRQAKNTAVSGVGKGAVLVWDQKDNALPMPVDWKDKATALAVRSSDFMEALNQQTLRVTGLTGGKYTLKINGAASGSFTAAALANGVNLAELETPMTKQAQAVHELTIKRSDVHNMRWRQVQMTFKDDHLARVPSILDNLDALESDLAVRQRAAAQPARYHYELVPE